MPESKSGALPTWLHPNDFLGLAHLGGFEPPAHGLEVRCSILLSYRCLLERVKGIEPSQPAWKAGALPLSYTRINSFFIKFKMVEESGFEPLKAKLTDLQSVPFGQLGNSSI